MSPTKQKILAFLYDYLTQDAYSFAANEIPDETFEQTTRALDIIEATPDERLEIYCTSPFLGPFPNSPEGMRLYLRHEAIARGVCLRELCLALFGRAIEGDISAEPTGWRQLFSCLPLDSDKVKTASGKRVEQIREYLPVAQIIMDLCNAENRSTATETINATTEEDHDRHREAKTIGENAFLTMLPKLFQFRQRASR